MDNYKEFKDDEGARAELGELMEKLLRRIAPTEEAYFDLIMGHTTLAWHTEPNGDVVYRIVPKQDFYRDGHYH